jgi:hypothetical protein
MKTRPASTTSDAALAQTKQSSVPTALTSKTTTVAAVTEATTPNSNSNLTANLTATSISTSTPVQLVALAAHARAAIESARAAATARARAAVSSFTAIEFLDQVKGLLSAPQATSDLAPNEVLKPFRGDLFPHPPRLDDIVEGELPNSALSAVMGTLVHLRPELVPTLIRKSFGDWEAKPLEVFKSKIQDTTATVDQALPVDARGEPRFGRGAGLWWPAFQRAMASELGGYANLDYVDISDVLGIEQTSFVVRSPEMKNGGLLTKLLEGAKRGHPMVAEANPPSTASPTTGKASDERARRYSGWYSVLGARLDGRIPMVRLHASKDPRLARPGERTGTFEIPVSEFSDHFVQLVCGTVPPPRLDDVKGKADLVDPTMLDRNIGPFGPLTSLKRLEGPLFGPEGASVDDVTQGSIGDCYFAAAVSALVGVGPKAIEKLLKDNGDGTYTVTFFLPSATLGIGGAGAPISVTVDADVYVTDEEKPLYGKPKRDDDPTPPTKKAEEGPKPIWFPILEKAFAEVKNKSYENIVSLLSNDSSQALEMLTGKPRRYAFSILGDDATWNKLVELTSAERPVAAATHVFRPALYKGTELRPKHQYAVLGVSVRDGQRLVKLRNPWGYQGAGASLNVGKEERGIFFMRLEDFTTYFPVLNYVGAQP